jgi:hypothetical protein
MVVGVVELLAVTMSLISVATSPAATVTAVAVGTRRSSNCSS